jgi:16S rRNA (guanine527-N7)-methyltransferase
VEQLEVKMILPVDKFKELFTQYGFEITEKQYNDFLLYAKLLVEWNEKINLTAITDAEGITVKHFLDSILLLKYAEIKLNSSLIDIGTGAGFPAVPLKIYRNDLDITLLDSLNKRLNFLNEVSQQLELPMKTVHFRAEEGAKKPELREKFDIAAARAVAALPVLYEYCLPYVKVGGQFIALKGPNEDYKAADTALKLLGGELAKAEEYKLPNGDSRLLIVAKKISQTSSKYPRNSSQIAKKSL